MSPLDAVILGALHGPAELLPVSSSGHVTLFAWLAGMPYAELPPERRKPIEVALHAGTALALALRPPVEGRSAPCGLRGLVLRSSMVLPTAALGFFARGAIRTGLGTPPTIAAGLTAGSAAMAISSASRGNRPATDAGIADALVIGVAQSAGLWPGVSRSGSAIVAARLRGFAAGDSARLARAGLISSSLAGSVLELCEAARDGLGSDEVPSVATAAAAAFASGIAARPLATRLERSGRILPLVLWRLGLATLTLLRIRSLREDERR